MVDKSILELCGDDLYYITQKDGRRLLASFRGRTDEEKRVLLKLLAPGDDDVGHRTTNNICVFD